MFKLLVKFYEWVMSYKNYFRTLEDLQKLDDRQLADIGISRCEIQRIADSSFRSRL